jgi:hypothetical protein
MRWIMAKDIFKRSQKPVLRAEKKAPESRSSHRRIVFFAAVILFIIIGGVLCQQKLLDFPANAERPVKEIRCTDQNVVVRSLVHADALIACEAAKDAIRYLSSQGMVVSGDVAIDLVATLPVVVSRSAAGCYLESERRAVALVYSQFKKSKTWFEIPINRSLYRSLISHEVAHLVAHYNFKIPKPTIQAKEYIAYVTQLATMESGLRKQIMSHFNCKAFEGDWQMCTTIYMFDCMGFGVRAYLHFLNLPNGRDYLQSILNGKALVE